ncbi:MAG: hypothetical protein KME42_09300 [Tildeniella nuda ZEHNDER 1965/U140]|jgi:hypothetical protein|nr:hypothetical protein [Tildeniella nuda ZEHNDER 1965/U140]
MDSNSSQRQQIIDTIQILPNATLAELQAFVQQLRDRTMNHSLQPQALDTERFDQLSTQLIELFIATRLPDSAPLSDYAVSREGIYGDHP